MQGKISDLGKEQDISVKYQQLSKEIRRMLKQFEKAKQWADIGQWLSKLQPILADAKFANVPHKIRLMKRLAQCLSPGIPTTIHGNALKIYQIILKNFGNKSQLLPLMSIGLFTFYTSSTTALRFELLKIFQQYYINTPQCLQMITSLTNTLLTSFLQNNEQLNKKIHQFFYQIGERYGRAWVDGAVWVNILKSPKVRNAGYKYLMKSFEERDKAKQEQQQEQQISESDNLQFMSIQEEQGEKLVKIGTINRSRVGKNQELQFQSQEKHREPIPQNQQFNNQFKDLTEQEAFQQKFRKKSTWRFSSSSQQQQEPKQPHEQKKTSHKPKPLTDTTLDFETAFLRQNLQQAYQNLDNFSTRFPNFSTLVFNAISQSLQSQSSDNMVRRSVLDLMINFLPLDRREYISEEDAVSLVSCVLHIVNLKQYSLTRRIYTYLFGKASLDGVYQIDPQQRQYQLQILKQSLNKILTPQQQLNPTGQNIQNNLNIILIILQDNEQLTPIILPSIAYSILNYIRITKITQQFFQKLNSQLFESYFEIFMDSIKEKIMVKVEEGLGDDVTEVLLTIETFYAHLTKLKQKDKQQKQKDDQKKTRQTSTLIQLLLTYLLQQKLKPQNPTIQIQILETCHKIITSKFLNHQLTKKSIQILNQLIQLKPPNTIYAKLLKLHPLPHKKHLLPYIGQTELGVTCIKNLLLQDVKEINVEERRELFFGVFKLFRYRIWQDKAVEFQKVYQQKYPAQFTKYINDVPIDQWLIYWTKNNGDVDINSILTILKSFQTQNKLTRQLLKKWLEDSKSLTKKIIDPIYTLLNLSQNHQILPIYRMIKRVFKGQRNQVSHLIYQQREKYFLPLVERIFQCIQSGNKNLKKSSVEMLEFLLENTVSLDEKLVFLLITFKKTILKLILTQKSEHQHQKQRQIQIVQYFISMADTFRTFKGSQQRISTLEQIIQGENLFAVMSEGMRRAKLPYLRTLYIQFMQTSIKTFLQLKSSSIFLSKILREISQSLYHLLKHHKITTIQQKMNTSPQTQTSMKTQPQQNIQTKYAQVLQIWNCLSFIYSQCLEQKVENLGILDLVGFVIEYFPFGRLKYQQISSKFIFQTYQELQNDTIYMTELKKQVLVLFNKLWNVYPIKIIDFLIEKTDPRILLHAKIDPTILIAIISKSSHIQCIKTYYKNQLFSIPKGITHYNSKVLLLQNQICYFLYLFLSYCEVEFISIKNYHLYEILVQLIKVINFSQHAQTKLWVLELLHLLTEKLSIKNTYEKGQNTKLKDQIQNLLTEVLQQITQNITKQRSITTRSYIKLGFFQKLPKQQLTHQKHLYNFIRPYPPTISKQQHLFKTSLKNATQQNLPQIEDETKLFIFNRNTEDLPEREFKAFISVVSIKSFTSILGRLVGKVFENQDRRVASVVKELLVEIFKVYGRKDQYSAVFRQSFAELAAKLFSNQHLKYELVQNLHKQVLQIFMSDDFFKCNIRTLKYWKSVLDACTDSYDLVTELISKEGLFQGLFQSKKQTAQTKIRNFQRVCFIIFSGRINKFEKKLRLVLQSLSKVMKSQNPTPSLLILILFCLRVILIRLKQRALHEMLVLIWPSLIALLIQIFTKQKYQKSINLRLAGLKMIQQIHALQLEQFNTQKWIFIFDYFGLKIQPQSSQTQQKTQQQPINLLTPFKYKPILTQILSSQPLQCTFIPQPTQPQPKHKNPINCKIIIKRAYITTQQQLHKIGLQLLQYMIDLGQLRANFNVVDIEEIIENDFVCLEEYIYDDE